MGLIRWFKGLFSSPPPRQSLLVVASGREVQETLAGLSAPVVHRSENDAGPDWWSVLLYELPGANATGLVAILRGRMQETHVTLIGLGGSARTQGLLASEARARLEKLFPVVPDPPAETELHGPRMR